MMKIIMQSFIIFFFLLLFSCATTSELKDTKKSNGNVVESQKDENKEKEVKKEKTEKDKMEEELHNDIKNEESEVKDVSEKMKKLKNYDGLKYIGPAEKKFSEGIGKYFTDGCETAVKSWKEAVEKDKDNHIIAYNIALCYERMMEFTESRNWYEKSFLLDTDFSKPLYNLVLMLGDTVKQEEKYFIDLIEKTEDIVVKNNFLAWFYFNLGKLDLTEKHAKLVLKEDEQNSEAVISLASVYFSKKMYELAESALLTAEKWDSENFRLHRLLGFLLYKTGDKNKAAIHLQKALKINPELPEVRNILAVLAMEIEDYPTAKEHLEFALKITPNFSSAKLNLALALKGVGNYKQSKELLIELEKNVQNEIDMNKSILFNMAILHLDYDVEGDRNPSRFDIAVEYFEKYLKAISKSKDFKKDKKLIDGYIKEAKSEKKKLEMSVAAQARAEKRKKALEEEHKQFLINKEKAFENAMKEDKFEIWEKYLNDFPVIDENDKFGIAAKARYEELKVNVETEAVKEVESENETENNIVPQINKEQNDAE